jgi:signal transduction histidine kinase/CheY-like chemotaxis protein
MDSNIVGIAFRDEERVITEANDAFFRLSGHTPGDFVGELSQREHLTASGERVPVLVGGASLEGGQGLVFALDIGELLRLEEKLRQTAKLESLGILAGGIAHDFNNLLTGILGNASLALEEAAPGSNIAELLRSVIQAGECAAALADQVLAYSGRGRFRREQVNLSELVSETLTLIGAALGGAVRLNLSISPALPFVEADPSQLQQIIMNLAINAAEAVDNKGEVSVRTGSAELDGMRHPTDVLTGTAVPAGRYVFLEVRDSGGGMDSATLQQIFDPFFTTKSAGRGLGLASVLGIVRSHRGAIRVTSSPGRGTTFTVYLPTSEGRQADQEPGPPYAHSYSGIVLVVDDEQYVRETVRRTLEAAGYTVVCAAGSSEAIHLVQSLGSQIVLAIVDLTMPGEGGDEVVRRLRHHNPTLKVIATSGYAEPEVKEKFGTLMDAFLPKPYRWDRLREIVAETLRYE